MRFVMALLLLAGSLPLADASAAKDQCALRCDIEKDMCLKRARSKAARKSCAAFRKNCKRGCSGR